MVAKRDRTLLVIGLPSTGKTTFLAALWHSLERGELLGALRLDQLQPDREYLMQIGRSWAAFEEVGRTRVGPPTLVSMRLRLAEAQGGDAGAPIEVVFPDTSGEMFGTQWQQRWWPTSYDSLVHDAVGALLFVHPGEVRAPSRIDSHARELVAILGGAPASAEAKTVSSVDDSLPAVNAEEVVRDPKRAPTQVMLVELLQFALFKRGGGQCLPVAVIVSAWDKLRPRGEAPYDWLRANLPLVHQFLAVNADALPSRVYGISAQGGDLIQDRQRLEQDYANPANRIEIVGHRCIAHDLSCPILWLLSYNATERPRG